MPGSTYVMAASGRGQVCVHADTVINAGGMGSYTVPHIVTPCRHPRKLLKVCAQLVQVHMHGSAQVGVRGGEYGHANAVYGGGWGDSSHARPNLAMPVVCARPGVRRVTIRWSSHSGACGRAVPVISARSRLRLALSLRCVGMAIPGQTQRLVLCGQPLVSARPLPAPTHAPPMRVDVNYISARLCWTSGVSEAAISAEGLKQHVTTA